MSLSSSSMTVLQIICVPQEKRSRSGGERSDGQCPIDSERALFRAFVRRKKWSYAVQQAAKDSEGVRALSNRIHGPSLVP